jgi:3D (Asp-Asp-Asp) domain-containing protein
VKDFETYIAAERRTAAGRSARREKSRRRRRGRMVSALAALAFLLSALLLLHFPAEAAAEPQQPVPTVLSPCSQPEAPAPEADENTRIECALLERAQVLDHVTVSHYCICEKCCGKAADHPAYGITASGVRAVPGVSVAVDPSIIPLGSDVLVDYGDGELHYYRADDTGSGVRGAHIDLCVSSHGEALALGLRTATVYFIDQEDEP